jgi:hypothetical protein
VITLEPTARRTPVADHDVVPVQIPDPPAEFVQVTSRTPVLSAAVPLRLTELALEASVDADGLVIVTDGAV